MRLRSKGERAQEEDFECTPSPCPGFGILQEALQQVQGVPEERTGPAVAVTCRIMASLGDAYPRQGQVLPLVEVAQVVLGG